MDKRTLLRFSVLTLALLSVGTADAQSQCTEQSFVITFSEFAQGTAISSQYSAKGVRFSSGSGYPFISPDGSNPTAPVLSGAPQFQGPITATFIAPADPATAVATTQLAFEAGYFDEIGSTQVTFLDINNASLGTVSNPGRGINTFTAPKGTHSFTIGSTSDAAGFAIDNLRYTIGPSSELTIQSPGKGSTFGLTENTHTRSPDISFTAGGSGATGPVSWTISMEYDTDRARGLPGLVSSIDTNGTATKKLYYQSRGGRARITASTKDDTACPLEYFYVVGGSIPEREITDRLVLLYRQGETPRLLTGIADKESTYRQFSVRSKYDKQALWPVESYDGGSHIGLMQMPSTVQRAWDWQINTQDAADLFREKLRIAAALERRIIQAHRGLRRLTSVERENMALTLYGPAAAAGLNNQYYRAIQLPDGTYDWTINTANNPAGVQYANDVRSRIR